ncbi:hypothetical protein FA13DRAFT_1742845 [Coprinellus micaceus]|uniref:Uncharacterized protein n=1 Tax=Coprinellus micaceus TaxID=71717 RepID=A0A4Y7SFB4_COPMI|nr:hypothetical protein FA13DRAFT_1742845 [Coprinellus micaceus]
MVRGGRTATSVEKLVDATSTSHPLETVSYQPGATLQFPRQPLSVTTPSSASARRMYNISKVAKSSKPQSILLGLTTYPWRIEEGFRQGFITMQRSPSGPPTFYDLLRFGAVPYYDLPLIVRGLTTRRSPAMCGSRACPDTYFGEMGRKHRADAMHVRTGGPRGVWLTRDRY